MKKTIGILGGMGPEATAYFFELIIKNTKAEKDQEHIPVIIYSNPEVPARTDAILEKGESPLPHLLEGARVLRQAGAGFIVMPCVTAHYFLDEIVAREKVSFLSLLDETLLYTQRKMPELKKAGLISSTGTLKSRLFHDAFAKEEIEVFGPEEGEQEQVTEAIFGKQGIKAGLVRGVPEKLSKVWPGHSSREGRRRSLPAAQRCLLSLNRKISRFRLSSLYRFWLRSVL